MHPAVAALARRAGIQYLLFRERLTSGVAYNLLSPALRADPYPTYHRLRARDPVHWSLPAQAWVITRYRDVQGILRDGRFSADRTNSTAHKEWAAKQKSPPDPPAGRSMLFVDPPDHTRLRMLVSKAFTPRAVEALRPRITRIVHGLLDDVERAGTMDVVRVLAYPLPVIVIAELLGIPVDDRELFKKWSDALAATLEPFVPKDLQSEVLLANEALRAYLSRIFAQRRREPRDDLISALMQAEEAGDRLTEEEAFSAVRLLLVAGHETTTNLIGNGLLALLRYQDQWRLLREDRTLIPAAVEELLRFDSPVQLTVRIATEPLDLDGKHIRPGDQLIVLLGAANRDPAQFSDPDRLLITREEKRHLAFGHGIHFCLGAPLARLEMQVTLSALLERFPQLHLTPEPVVRRQTMVLRGLDRLAVAF
ncbi:MAG TPA: cytochrome P450 [bacterium]